MRPVSTSAPYWIRNSQHDFRFIAIEIEPVEEVPLNNSQLLILLAKAGFAEVGGCSGASQRKLSICLRSAHSENGSR